MSIVEVNNQNAKKAAELLKDIQNGGTEYTVKTNFGHVVAETFTLAEAEEIVGRLEFSEKCRPDPTGFTFHIVRTA